MKTVKKHTECTYPKILVLIWNQKAKVKSKYAACLTDRTFFDKINNECEPEQLVKQLFLYWCFLWKNMKISFVKCRKNTENLNSKIFKTKNGILIMQSKCTECGFKKSRFVKERDAKGLLSNLDLKTRLSKIPLFGIYFFECIKWMKLWTNF